MGSPEECTNLRSASLCVPRGGLGRNRYFAEHGSDICAKDVTRGVVVDITPRSPQIITFCAEKGPPTLHQELEQTSTRNDITMEESLSYKDGAQHKVVCGKGVARDIIVTVTGNKHTGLSRHPIGFFTDPTTC